MTDNADSLHQAQDDFRSALCDSFNTSAALSALLDVVAKTNIYFSARGAAYNIAPVQAVALWVTRMLRMFGLGEGPYEEGVVGWGKEGEAAGGGDVSLSSEGHAADDYSSKPSLTSTFALLLASAMMCASLRLQVLQTMISWLYAIASEIRTLSTWVWRLMTGRVQVRCRVGICADDKMAERCTSFTLRRL